jgi:hypothetical protein
MGGFVDYEFVAEGNRSGLKKVHDLVSGFIEEYPNKTFDHKWSDLPKVSVGAKSLEFSLGTTSRECFDELIVGIKELTRCAAGLVVRVNDRCGDGQLFTSLISVRNGCDRILGRWNVAMYGRDSMALNGLKESATPEALARVMERMIHWATYGDGDEEELLVHELMAAGIIEAVEPRPELIDSPQVAPIVERIAPLLAQVAGQIESAESNLCEGDRNGTRFPNVLALRAFLDRVVLHNGVVKAGEAKSQITTPSI